jgi:hypothetical protein
MLSRMRSRDPAVTAQLLATAENNIGRMEAVLTRLIARSLPTDQVEQLMDQLYAFRADMLKDWPIGDGGSVAYLSST